MLSAIVHVAVGASCDESAILHANSCGDRIAFQSDRDGNWEIYVMNVDGTDVQRLTDNDVKDEGPEWRP